MQTRVQRALRALKQSFEVKALERGRNHPKIRKRRIATTDIRRIQEDAPKTVALTHFLHHRSGVSNWNEVFAGAFALDFAHAIEEVLVEHQRLCRSARLAGDHEKRVRQINPMFKALDR